jgi:hypothetical protein
MPVVSWSAAVNVIGLLQHLPALQGRFYVAGGLVPWLIAYRDSGRLHGDIDLVVARPDMLLFRNAMQRCGYYNPATDSQCVWPHLGNDHGFDVVIDGVMVNIAPFEVESSGIVQRNATYAATGDANSHVALLIPSLSWSDYVTHTRWHDRSLLGHYPLALVYATKCITQRPKDAHDCAELDRLGVSADDIARYRDALQHMQFITDD